MTAFDAITWWFLLRVFGVGFVCGIVFGWLLLLVALWANLDEPSDWWRRKW